jgi:hypothetical protein
VVSINNPTWSEWERVFAWLPIKLWIRDEDQIQSRWLWLRSYWVRERTCILTYSRNDAYYVEYDYAFDLFDLLRKS